MPPLTRKQVREVDRLAIHEYGVPGVVLMENAGRNAAEIILDLLLREKRIAPETGRVVVLCGGGNNGGDGYVIARHLANFGVPVTVQAAVDPARLTGDAAVMADIWGKLGNPVQVLATSDLDAAVGVWREADILVDALLGTGFHGQVRPELAAVIDRLNATPGPTVVAVDVPSGLDCDMGQPSNATVRAALTVTFVDTKTGFGQPGAAAYTGRVVVADIGIPDTVVQRALQLDA